MTISEHDAGLVYGRVVTRVKRPSRRAAQKLLEVLVEDARVEIRHADHAAPVPPQVHELLTQALLAIEDGEIVTLVIGTAPDTKELSSQEAADLLNVSRPHVVKLARDGDLPHRMVGNRHRFVRADVLAYKTLQDARRAKVLQEMAAQGGAYTAADF